VGRTARQGFRSKTTAAAWVGADSAPGVSGRCGPHQRTGCFNLTLGALGVAISVGASLSTFFTGISAAAFGARMAVLGLALAGLCG
jgi:hypothetical protein